MQIRALRQYLLYDIVLSRYIRYAFVKTPSAVLFYSHSYKINIPDTRLITYLNLCFAISLIKTRDIIMKYGYNIASVKIKR